MVKPKRRKNDQGNSPHNYIIVSKLTGAGESKLVHALNTFGSFGEAMPGVFVLRSNTKLSVIQKNLHDLTQERDKILIVDATANRLGWFNLGPEADVHLKSVWDKKLD